MGFQTVMLHDTQYRTSSRGPLAHCSLRVPACIDCAPSQVAALERDGRLTALNVSSQVVLGTIAV